MRKLIVLCIGLTIMLAGCGGGGSGDTNGTLTLNDLALTDMGGGEYSVQATAAYSPPAGKDPQGMSIGFSATFETSTEQSVRSANIEVGSNGIANAAPWRVTQTNQPIRVTVVASLGGLRSIKTTLIPALSGLSGTPAAVSFGTADGIGATKTITISGGYSPYVVSSSVPADINAQLAGNAITLTKLVNVTAGSPVGASATVTITDNRGNQISIPVGYYK